MAYWNERLLDVYMYAVCVGLLQGVLTALCLALGLAFSWRRGRRSRWVLAARILIFSAALYVVGFAANSVWMLVAYERWYFSADTVVDFLPFVPFGQWALDYRFGSYQGGLLNGTQLWQLQVLWLFLAAPCWAASAWVTRRVTGRWLRGQHHFEARHALDCVDPQISTIERPE